MQRTKEKALKKQIFFTEEAYQRAKKETKFIQEAISLYLKFEENPKKEFICLRCGACCIIFDIFIGNLQFTLANQYCLFLIPRSLEQKEKKLIWHEAQCAIHSNPQRPSACMCFEEYRGFNGLCPIGRAVWLHTQKSYPTTQLPKWITNHLSKTQHTQL